MLDADGTRDAVPAPAVLLQEHRRDHGVRERQLPLGGLTCRTRCTVFAFPRTTGGLYPPPAERPAYIGVEYRPDLPSVPYRYHA